MTRDTIGSIDPDALKIPARRAEDYLTRYGGSPFPAEPGHTEMVLQTYLGYDDERISRLRQAGAI